MTKTITLSLKIWRQKAPDAKGGFETYDAGDISVDMSFLEMLDVVNERLTLDGRDPIAFDHDCREGICGACGSVVNGRPHGHVAATTLCQLHMRHFKDSQTLVIEPWRSKAFPVIKDLVVDRSTLDKIIQAGGYISVTTGGAQEANTILIPTDQNKQAMDAATCIGCGACVAACPNSSAMLFIGASVSHLVLLPQGKPEAAKRVLSMVRKMDELGFGNCSNETECEVECPKEISITNIACLNREFIKAGLFSTEE